MTADASQQAALALAALRDLVARGDEPDDLLREAVTILRDQAGLGFAGVAFVEEGSLVLGPHAGSEPAAGVESFPVRFNGGRVADLVAGPELDDGARALLREAAELLAPYCLVGWDTGGEPWEP